MITAQSASNDSTMIGTLVGVGVAAGVTLMKVYNAWFATKSSTTKLDAESTLYENMKSELERLSKRVEDHDTDKELWSQEREKWVRIRDDLHDEIARLGKLEELNNGLRVKITQKDEQITKLINEVVMKTTEITELRERVFNLEKRATRDEEDCPACKARMLSDE